MARYVLAVVEGPARGRELELAAMLELGREVAQGLGLEGDEQLSRRHARLTPVEDGVLVEDLGSRNGTSIDGRRIEAPTVARPGARVVLGGTALEVRRVTEAAALAAEPEYVLEVVRGPGIDQTFPVARALEIGRDPALDIVLEDEQVSRRHARLAVGEDGVLVEDLGSRNGTLLNGRRIRQPAIVRPGDRLTVGETALELRRPGSAATRLAPVVTTSTTRPGWTFVITSAALFMAVLDSLVVTFALPQIQVELDASLEQLEWTVNAFTLPFAVFLLTGATLGDRLGRKRVFSIGIVVFSLASAACALAPNIETLLAARAAQGLGAACIVPLSLTLVSAAFPGERRELALGAWSGIAGLAVAIGPVVGGVIATGLSWQWIFWLNVPIGLLAFPLAVMWLTESYGPQNRLDGVGVVLVSTGLFGLVYGVVRGPTVGWTSAEVLASLVVGGVLTIAFLVWELRAPAPMLAMHLFKSRAFSAVNAVSFVMYFAIFGIVFLLSQFLQVAQGYSALEAGLRSLPWTGMPILVAPIGGILTDRIGGRPLIAAGLALQCAALTWLALVLAPDVSFGELLPPFVLGGVGMGLFFAPASIVVLGAVQVEEEGQASGINNTLRQLGTVFGVAVMGTIFASFGSYVSPQAFTDGVVPATWVSAVALGGGALIALLIPRLRPTEAREELNTSVPALGGMTPVTSVHAIVSAAEAVPRWELRSVSLAEADGLDPGEWEPFAVAKDRLYLRRVLHVPGSDGPSSRASDQSAAARE